MVGGGGHDWLLSGGMYTMSGAIVPVFPLPMICFPRLPSPNAVQELLDKYTSDTLIQQEEEAKALLGYS